MDVIFELNGVRFIWDARKAQRNAATHGVEFQHAAQTFFDPFLRLVDASRNDEFRDAIIGTDSAGRLLLVVHVQIHDEAIRIISARKATPTEREAYDP